MCGEFTVQYMIQFNTVTTSDDFNELDSRYLSFGWYHSILILLGWLLETECIDEGGGDFPALFVQHSEESIFFIRVVLMVPLFNMVGNLLLFVRVQRKQGIECL